MAPERVCYVQCNFCNTILAVSVPCSSMLTIVTVRCGHCANLLSVNMGALLRTVPLQDPPQKQQSSFEFTSKESGESSSSSKCSKFDAFGSDEIEPPRMPPIHPPEKRQRIPSAYNRFIKEEIQRIKSSNPDISHREAFSTAAKKLGTFPSHPLWAKVGWKQESKVRPTICRKWDYSRLNNCFLLITCQY